MLRHVLALDEQLRAAKAGLEAARQGRKRQLATHAKKLQEAIDELSAETALPDDSSFF